MCKSVYMCVRVKEGLCAMVFVRERVFLCERVCVCVCAGVCVCVDTCESAARRVSVRSFVEETVDCVSVRVRLYVSVRAGVHVGVDKCLCARTSSHVIVAESYFW